MIGLRSKRILTDTVIYVVLAVMVVVWLFPLVWMIVRAFDTNTSAGALRVFPNAFTLDNFIRLFTGPDYDANPYFQWMLNTLFIAVISCVISTLMVLMVSYALSRLRFKARKMLMNIALILGLFPGFLSLIALYQIFSTLGFTGSSAGHYVNLLGLAIAYSLGAGAGYYIVKGFFDTVPIAIDEAARIDGATKNRIFWQMIIPLSKPIIVYTILTNFISPWCDFIMAKMFLPVSMPERYTIAVGLRYFVLDVSRVPTHFTRFCAGGVLISIPIVILFLVMQKFYVEGITGGAAKG